MIPEVLVREAVSQEDVDAIYALYSRIFESLAPFGRIEGVRRSDNDRWFKLDKFQRNGFNDSLKGEAKIIVAESRLNQNVVGASIVEFSRYGENHGDLHIIGVDSEYRNRGIGAEILNLTSELCVSAGLLALRLDTNKNVKQGGNSDFWNDRATMIGAVDHYYGPLSLDATGLFYILHLR